jgi:hypothetical protein
MDIDKVLEEKIQAFVAELHALVKQAAVASVKEALGVDGGVAPAPRPAKGKGARKAARGTRGKTPAVAKAPEATSGRRSPEQLKKTVRKLEQQVQAAPGQRIEDIAKALGVPSAALALPVKKLIAAGTIRKEGVKRNTRYFPAKK